MPDHSTSSAPGSSGGHTNDASPNSRNRTCVILSELFDRAAVISSRQIPQMSAAESAEYRTELLCVSHLVSPEDVCKITCTLKLVLMFSSDTAQVFHVFMNMRLGRINMAGSNFSLAD